MTTTVESPRGATLTRTAAYCAAAAVLVLGLVGTSPPADAYPSILGGTYRVVSNGDWAKVNDVYIDQQTVVQTWTFNVSCVSPIECTGEVVSDRGWTGTVRLDDFWLIDHDIPDWAPCPDGSFAPGHQKFVIWGFNQVRAERTNENANLLIGRDITKTASGACGINKPLVIEMPVRADKTS